MDLNAIQSALDILTPNLELGSENGQQQLYGIIEELKGLLFEESKYKPIPNSLENFKRMIFDDHAVDETHDCSYYRQYSEDYWLDHDLFQLGIDFNIKTFYNRMSVSVVSVRSINLNNDHSHMC